MPHRTDADHHAERLDAARQYRHRQQTAHSLSLTGIVFGLCAIADLAGHVYTHAQLTDQDARIVAVLLIVAVLTLIAGSVWGTIARLER